MITNEQKTISVMGIDKSHIDIPSLIKKMESELPDGYSATISTFGGAGMNLYLGLCRDEEVASYSTFRFSSTGDKMGFGFTGSMKTFLFHLNTFGNIAKQIKRSYQ